MNELDQLFKNALNASTKGKTKFSLLVGTVKEIDNDTCTVDHYEDVRLNAIIGDFESQFTVYPKIGSKVIIGRLENEDNAFILRVSEIDKVKIKISDQIFELKDQKFRIENKDANLKSILNDAFNQIDKAVIMTPSGPGNFSPADKVFFKQLNEKTNKLLS
ncbi:hypothetical protein [Flavobacterium sp. B183]|uniref:hypothetical protein n=1 Tax=Flavobacterium sp. B183 TaxID=907046 RepID=UPI00201F7D13|nr:hypothetical protein [Flavobacterium sp. B183]URC13943.1 hypothetical protein M4I44_05975 [Flavobacterium sp. B183]URC14035.1 hypothetical protein M4I44_06505 [Flavobacterium sp. B183]